MWVMEKAVQGRWRGSSQLRRLRWRYAARRGLPAYTSHGPIIHLQQRRPVHGRFQGAAERRSQQARTGTTRAAHHTPLPPPHPMLVGQQMTSPGRTS